MMKPIFCLLLSIPILCSSQIVYPGKDAGPAKASLTASVLLLQNNILSASWTVKDGMLMAGGLVNKESNTRVNLDHSAWFSVLLKNGTTLSSNDFKLKAFPQVQDIQADAHAVKYSNRFTGKKITADFYSKSAKMAVHWDVQLKAGANYVTQHITVLSPDSLELDKLTLLDIPGAAEIRPSGVVTGSALVGNGTYWAIESPIAQSVRSGKRVCGYIKLNAAIPACSPLNFSVVWGIYPKGQLRRAFAYYIERERAQPYRQELHYNSWYDISWADRKLTDSLCLDRIKTYGDSLIVKRKTPLKSFLFDDGWDDNQSLWQINKANFPNGFTNMEALAKKYKSTLGVWISPWGGYEEAKRLRLEYGKKQSPAFETNENGFSLSSPVYNARFRGVAKSFVEKYGITLFKFDGLGAGDASKGVDPKFEKDVNALLGLVTELRGIQPDLYFSLTIGTWPSPYWLFYGDAIWRNGGDTGLAGTGSKRQQWITYRDAQAYLNICKRGPLFPINSLMYHGICIADHGVPESLNMDDSDIAAEIWSFFATGTSVQELYINPHKLSPRNWDVLAKAIQWSGQNKSVFPDVHWIGGDPGKAEVYGWAAWSAKKAVLSLRNPSAQLKTFHVNVAGLLELPVKKAYQFYNAKNKEKVASGMSFDIVLQPYEVKVMDGYPVNTTL
jgi:hypothetical protein